MDSSSPIADVQQAGSRVVIRVREREVDANALRELIASLRKQLVDGEAHRFVFCLNDVEFLPSACLAQLLLFYQDVRKADGAIVLANCQENVVFLLRLARLDALFQLAQGDPQEL